MKKSIVAAALVSTAFASPALARDDSWYVELDAGATKVEDNKFDIGVVPDAASLGFRTGPDIGGILGYDFGPFRLEAEASWRRVRPNELTTLIRLPGSTAASGPGFFTGRATQFTGDSKAESLSLMVNGLIDFGPDDGVQGFVGGGVQAQSVQVVGLPIGASGTAMPRNGGRMPMAVVAALPRLGCVA